MQAGDGAIGRTGRGAAAGRGTVALALGLPLLVLLSLVMVAASVMTGASTASVFTLLKALFADPAPADAALFLRDRIVITEVRMPRAVGSSFTSSRRTTVRRFLRQSSRNSFRRFFWMW